MNNPYYRSYDKNKLAQEFVINEFKAAIRENLLSLLYINQFDKQRVIYFTVNDDIYEDILDFYRKASCNEVYHYK